MDSGYATIVTIEVVLLVATVYLVERGLRKNR